MEICIIGDSIASAKQNDTKEYTDLFKNCLLHRFSNLSSNVSFFEKVYPGVDSNVGMTWISNIPKNYDLYIICFGINDSAKHHFISKEQYAQNMKYFSTYFLSPVFIVTPPVVNELLTLPKRNNYDINLYSKELRKQQVKYLIDLNLWMNLYSNSDFLRQPDGLHLSKEGYNLLSDLIFDKFISIL